MDFFHAQDQAYKRSRKLVALFILALAATIISIYFVVMVVFGFVDEPGFLWNPQVFLVVAGITMGIVTLGSLFKIASLSSGGSAVAKALGGQQVNPSTRDPRERQLMNIVEEMSIASGVPVPAVYILPNEGGINAFAAGYKAEDACVAVTAGALEQLTRDEMQGVVAHEFAHIRHGDMRLNIRLIGFLHGLLILALIGRGMMYSMRFALVSSGRRRGSKDDLSAVGILLAIALIGLAIWIIGFLGALFSKLIQSAVSRQREFLADAAAVELTRNPKGLSDALKRVAGYPVRGRIDHRDGPELAHMFFASCLRSEMFSWTATHPPIEQRIRALDPAFNPEIARNYGAAAATGRGDARTAGLTGSTEPPPRPASGAAEPPPIPASPAAAAARFLTRLPAAVREATREPRSALALTIALMISQDEASKHPESITAAKLMFGDETGNEAEALLREITQDVQARALILVELCTPMLRALNRQDHEVLLGFVNQCVSAKDEIDLHVFCLAMILEAGLRPPRRLEARAPDFDEVVADALAWIRVLVAFGTSDEVARRRTWSVALQQLQVPATPWQEGELPSKDSLGKSLRRLADASPLATKRVLDAARAAVHTDGRVGPEERELLRTFSAALGAPMPFTG
jgi:Zn-dependent protease with chaperone function